MANRWANNGNSDRLSWAPKSLQVVTAAMKLKNTCCLEETLCKPRLCIKKQSHHFANKGLHGQTYGISSSHVWMWELDHSEGWMLNNWCFWTMVLEMALESPFDSKEIKSVNPKGNQPWIFIGRTDAKAEVLALWPPHAKSWLFGRLWCWERLRAREGDDREWDAWMASVTQWIWVWTNSGR